MEDYKAPNMWFCSDQPDTPFNVKVAKHIREVALFASFIVFLIREFFNVPTVQEAYRSLCDRLKDRSEIQAIGVGDTGVPETSFIAIYFYAKPLFKYPTEHMGYEVKHRHNAKMVIGPEE